MVVIRGHCRFPPPPVTQNFVVFRHLVVRFEQIIGWCSTPCYFTSPRRQIPRSITVYHPLSLGNSPEPVRPTTPQHGYIFKNTHGQKQFQKPLCNTTLKHVGYGVAGGWPVWPGPGSGSGARGAITDVALHHGKVLQCIVGYIPRPTPPHPTPPVNIQTENMTFGR